MIFHWGPDPALLRLGGLEIRYYGLLFALGFLLGVWLMQRVFVQEKKPLHLIDPLLLQMMLGVVLGARLGHCLFYEPEFYLSRPWEILMVWKGGLASHGAGIGIFVALWLFSRRHPETPFVWLLDRLSIAIALAGGLIRLGNLMNSEIIGKPTQGDWGMVFTLVDSLPRHPAQGYEAICYLLLAGLLWRLYQAGHGQAPGRLAGVFLVVAFGFRLMVEGVKENQALFESSLPLNMGQLLSLPMILIGLAILLRSRRGHDGYRS